MPRPISRVHLESGLKLDLNDLVREGSVRQSASITTPISWSNNYTGDKIASGFITAHTNGPDEGWFPNEGRLDIEIGDLKQRISMISRPRHFGGRQWYFICPSMGRHVSVLWKPPGAREFACRQKWGRLVAYSSQCSAWTDRAHRGKARIKTRLCSLGGFDPAEWEFPPKPKWMRWRTYLEAKSKFDRYRGMLNRGAAQALAKLRLVLPA